MKKYEFTATTKNGDMIIGLSYSVVFGFIILLVQLGFFYSGLGKVLRKYPPLLILLVFLVLCVGNFLVKKIQKGVIKHYVVEFDEINIKIKENGKEIMFGEVSFCKVIVKDNKSTSSINIDIHTYDDKISFRARTKKYITITGKSSFNPFGTSDISDIKILLDLGNKIKCVLKYNTENNK